MDDVIYVNKPLSSRTIVNLLDKYPTLNKIKCPKSLYLRTSKKYLDALSELGIEVEPTIKRGRPKKYVESDVKNVNKMLKDGATPSEISDALQIPLKSVYYIKNVRLKRGRKPKYSKETEEKVKKMYKKGVSANKISEMLNMPLRTVYYLLKR